MQHSVAAAILRRPIAGAFIGGAESGVSIRFTAGGPELENDAWKVRVHAEDTTTGRYVGTVLDLRRSGYLASALFAALALVTPLRPRRRIGLLLGGLALLQILPVLPLLSFFSGKLPVQAFHFGPATRTGVEIAYHTLVAPPGMAYAVPALLWLLLVWILEPTCLRLPRFDTTPAPEGLRRAVERA